MSLKYELYEKSVQSPEYHAEWFVSIYKELTRKYPRRLREDFCGTFRLSSAWVARNRQNTGLALDLDPEPLRFGLTRHWAELSADQRKRLSVRKQDVLKPTRPFSDMIVACNFSFNVFHDRKTLTRYFKAAHRSLGRNGVFLLEMAGGPGMCRKMRERKSFRKRGKPWFTYIWDQKSFDPITHHADYSIHFKMADGKWIRDAFTYDWRLWTIPEVRDALAEAGFKRSVVYWETAHKGEGTGEYVLTEEGDNSYAWVAYVIGLK